MLLNHEEQEIKRILSIIDAEIENLKPEKIYMLDLHTTSSAGGIFCIALLTMKKVLL